MYQGRLLYMPAAALSTVVLMGVKRDLLNAFRNDWYCRSLRPAPRPERAETDRGSTRIGELYAMRQ